MVAGGAIAASLAAALVLPNFMRSGSEIFTGSPGRIRQVVLADGSRLHLAGASSVEVAFRDDERRVKLLQGEGWFEVAKDRSRPFIVETGDVSVRAVGTAFSVGRFDGQAEVLVTEGIIDLTTVRGGAVAARMHQGDIAKIGRGGLRLAKLTDEETRRQLAWREGGISLDGETLVQAAAMFNRFNTTQIAIDDTALSKQAVVGWFAFNDPQGFSRAAASMFDADVTRQGNTIRLTRHH
jgi:transmembrane sensor